MKTIFLRGFTIVAITACNVVLVAGGHYASAFISGGLLSWVWWYNANHAARDNSSLAAASYALGAATGTVTGMAIGRWLQHWLERS